ncbi:hypothetical protein A3E97_05095 [Candidatus Uhrbacteria bacterium RIFCSPHIGHO2_12_FULL_47_12]|nr:MAG: hypothetical protein A3E97_05095 [Candidatus Uhrbacteria bacterium RIFCSPHIGHO2_12_FULL_47_12]
MISSTTIQEFRDLAKTDYGRELSFEEAAETLRDLVSYFNLLGRIAHRENLDTKGRTVSPLNKNRLNTF